MVFFIFFFLFIFIALYCYRLKLFIDFPSFFKRGFKKIDNAFGVYCYCGKQGSGKTYSSIKFLIENKLRFGYTIITNVHSFNVFPDTLYFDNFHDIMNFILKLPQDEQKNYIIFYDEIFTLLEKSTRINKDILSFLSQLRKRNIILVTTAQEWLEINITFRRYVRFQVDCKMISIPITKSALLVNCINDGYGLKWSNDENEYIAPRLTTKIMKGNKSIIDSYDTFETINVS